MTDASWTDIPAPGRESRVPAVSLPAPAPLPMGPPVLIGDVATPLAGETLLGLLLKRMARRGADDDNA